MTDANIVTAALRYAAGIYEGIYRPDSSRTPFVTHLSETADLVARAGGTPEEVAAAWLHDVVEDGHATLATIREQFGSSIAALVEAVTDPAEIGVLPIKERKAAQARRLAEACDGAKRIKMGEQISILRALAVERPASWTIERSIDYVAGARQVADICRDVSSFLSDQFAAAHAAAEKALP
ncbi:HD domain-containing protein [Azospirillum thermophilum]|uniref:Bifunctional (P)ppGpp synthetase/guanosine-3',5'-bis(Diphosphate) 3'-pyrophosphohydrolase n=1 Tax=Azospirillum thermophilum TaxID=2202148 RepID=A0A2S2CKE2_9PROT|nr:HD domain-containing protein [Azospirillum thermophilum]AWK84985.1 bifunctional (p)ppGpp synthetase/guanosine-3',5'-bis(diphosphate) 3'-pyrophosphohydrolase [Azospirillum thermophilum]